MKKTKIFTSIPVEPPYEAIVRRLGFRIGTTSVTSQRHQEIDRLIEGAAALISLRGAARRHTIKQKSGSVIILDFGARFDSGNLNDFLRGCDELLLIAATAGSQISKAISRESAGKNVQKAVIWDAVASEMVDEALGWMIRYYNAILRRENKALTPNRFSCGYGDFLLENQKTIYGLLGLEALDVRITKNYILLPEKSVTAIAGIKELR